MSIILLINLMREGLEKSSHKDLVVKNLEVNIYYIISFKISYNYLFSGI